VLQLTVENKANKGSAAGLDSGIKAVEKHFWALIQKFTTSPISRAMPSKRASQREASSGT